MGESNLDPMTQLSQTFSWGVLLGLGAIFAASLAMFLLIARRWTTDHERREIDEWARQSGYSPGRGTIPGSLNGITGPVGSTIQTLGNGKQMLLRIASQVPDAGATHVLLRPIESDWKPTGLRPVSVGSPLIERMGLDTTLLTGEAARFSVVGTDSASALALGDSSIRALLPADVGLVLWGTDVMLDFSTRPFDPIEFGRMNALADQLVAHLPIVGSVKR